MPIARSYRRERATVPRSYPKRTILQSAHGQNRRRNSGLLFSIAFFFFATVRMRARLAPALRFRTVQYIFVIYKCVLFVRIV